LDGELDQLFFPAISAAQNTSNVFSISLNSNASGNFIVGGSDPNASGLPAYSFSQGDGHDGYFYIYVQAINGIPSTAPNADYPNYRSWIEPGLQYIDIPNYFTNSSNNNLITFSNTMTQSPQGCTIVKNLLNCACNSNLTNYGLNNLVLNVEAGITPNFFLVDLVISPAQYLRSYSNGICSTFIRPVSAVGTIYPVLGTDFLKNFYTTYTVNGTSSVLQIAAIPGVSSINTQNIVFLPHLLNYGN